MKQLVYITVLLVAATAQASLDAVNPVDLRMPSGSMTFSAVIADTEQPEDLVFQGEIAWNAQGYIRIEKHMLAGNPALPPEEFTPTYGQKIGRDSVLYISPEECAIYSPTSQTAVRMSMKLTAHNFSLLTEGVLPRAMMDAVQAGKSTGATVTTDGEGRITEIATATNGGNVVTKLSDFVDVNGKQLAQQVTTTTTINGKTKRVRSVTMRFTFTSGNPTDDELAAILPEGTAKVYSKLSSGPVRSTKLDVAGPSWSCDPQATDSPYPTYLTDCWCYWPCGGTVIYYIHHHHCVPGGTWEDTCEYYGSEEDPYSLTRTIWNCTYQGSNPIVECQWKCYPDWSWWLDITERLVCSYD